MNVGGCAIPLKVNFGRYNLDTTRKSTALASIQLRIATMVQQTERGREVSDHEGFRLPMSCV